MTIYVERTNNGVTSILNLKRSWGSYDEERGLAAEDFVLCYKVIMRATTPNGRPLEYLRVGDKVLVNQR